jgi:hypothetical protein
MAIWASPRPAIKRLQKNSEGQTIVYLSELCSIDLPILRTELSSQNTVGAEVSIIGMGFNQSWIQV